ncbi:MAG: aryl-sulfate sulfotransferase [Candidatus Puniceispirillum sp.]|nr:aryl-sulfate sulfotransferase [Candidatus Pelagibacter sp.]MBA4282900.1 aryl-sulfate sulfotransferase [Candidatus Puniceispirillum sp.]
MIKKSFVIMGHPTSIRLEEAFWHELQLIAQSQGISLKCLIEQQDNFRDSTNFASYLRTFVLQKLNSRMIK